MFPIRDINPTRSTPWVTWSIILACGLVWLGQWVMPPGAHERFAFDWGLVPRQLTHGHDPLAWATVATHMFLHGGWMHVLGNLWFLYIFGDNVEDNMGPARFAVFYLLSGVAAAGAQVLSNPEAGVPMVGASGAIAGVLAAYMVLFPRARVLTFLPIPFILYWVELPAVVFLVVWFGMQFFSGLGSLGQQSGGGVAYWAHIGGFLAGLVMVFFFRRQAPPRDDGWRVVRLDGRMPPPRAPRSSTPWHDSRGW
ncbi:MAG: rhomboid family intramembrane serine protease [Polyangiales bacterium]